MHDTYLRYGYKNYKNRQLKFYANCLTSFSTGADSFSNSLCLILVAVSFLLQILKWIAESIFCSSVIRRGHLASKAGQLWKYNGKVITSQNFSKANKLRFEEKHILYIAF